MLKNKSLTITISLLFFLSIAVIYFFTYQEYLYLRVGTILVLIVLSFFLKILNNKVVLTILLLLLGFNILSVDLYDDYIVKYEIVLRTITYMFFTFLIRKKLKFKSDNKGALFLYGLLIMLNFYLLYFLIDLAGGSFLDNIDKIAAIICCIFMLIACVTATNYNNNRFHRTSTYYMIFVYVLAFSDVLLFSSVFLDLSYMFYVERLFALVAYFFFISFSLRIANKSSLPS